MNYFKSIDKQKKNNKFLSHGGLRLKKKKFKEPTFSIITVVLNGEKYIENTIKSPIALTINVLLRPPWPSPSKTRTLCLRLSTQSARQSTFYFDTESLPVPDQQRGRSGSE